jgi:hypothetical protein
MTVIKILKSKPREIIDTKKVDISDYNAGPRKLGPWDTNAEPEKTGSDDCFTQPEKSG